MVAEALSRPSADAGLLLSLANFVRRSVTNNKAATLDFIVELEFVPKLVALLGTHHPKIQAEVAWALSEIAAKHTEYCDLILQVGGHEQLVALLSPSSLDLSEEVTIILKN